MIYEVRGFSHPPIIRITTSALALMRTEQQRQTDGGEAVQERRRDLRRRDFPCSSTVGLTGVS